MTASVLSPLSSMAAAGWSRAMRFRSRPVVGVAGDIGAALPHGRRAVIDGEIVCLDKRGRPHSSRPSAAVQRWLRRHTDLAFYVGKQIRNPRGSPPCTQMQALAAITVADEADIGTVRAYR